MSAPQKSYHQILKSSFVVGGASFINIVLGIVRTKVLALLLGPSGLGVLGIYNSVVQTASSLGGLGIGRSGVRQIAECANSGATSSSAKPIAATLRWSLILGVVSGVAVVCCRKAIGELTFHRTTETAQIGWLGVAVAASILTAGHLAVIQGNRYVRFLAEQNVIGALLGTLVSIPIIYFFRRGGILLVVLVVPLIGLVTSWVYMRRLPLIKVSLGWHDYWSEGGTLIKLGAILMITSLLSSATLLLARTIINRQMGEAATGYFQAAFSVSVIYLDFILQSMAADFYPRLTAASSDRDACNRLVNEQMEIALLMGGPLILAMLAFSQLVVQLLYSKDFGPACELLRWQMLGNLLKVASWPIGFIFLARNQGMRFFACELLWHCTYLSFIFFGIKRFGLIVAGTGFCVAYSLLLVWTLLQAAQSTRFRLNTENRVLLVTLALLCLAMFVGKGFVPFMVYYELSALIIAACGLWCGRKLLRLIGTDKMKALRHRFIGF